MSTNVQGHGVKRQGRSVTEYEQ